MKIGVVGLGAVGETAYTAMSMYHDVSGYDIDENKSKDSWSNTIDSELVFVCVPTPADESSGRLDSSAVDSVLRKLEDDGYEGVVCIESTLPVGFLSNGNYDNMPFDIVYKPEWLRERSRLKFFTNIDRLVLGCPDPHTEIVTEEGRAVRPHEVVLKALKPLDIKDVPIMQTDYRTAEVIKLLHNAHIAIMVSTTNEFKRISEELGVQPTKVMRGIYEDHRRSKAWMDPTKGGFSNSDCVPKDTSEILSKLDDKKKTKMLNAAFAVEKDVQESRDGNQHAAVKRWNDI